MHNDLLPPVNVQLINLTLTANVYNCIVNTPFWKTKTRTITIDWDSTLIHIPTLQSNAEDRYAHRHYTVHILVLLRGSLPVHSFEKCMSISTNFRGKTKRIQRMKRTHALLCLPQYARFFPLLIDWLNMMSTCMALHPYQSTTYLLIVL